MLWFTSDTHFGHINITKFRPKPDGTSFEDVLEHDNTLISNWNSVVPPDGRVIVLGDFVMGHKEQTLERVVPQLNGEITLVPGNHDGPWSGNLSTEKRVMWASRYRAFNIRIAPESTVFSSIGSFESDCLCSHFPYTSDSRHQDKYFNHHPEDEGLPLLHGHVHDLWKTNGRQINVGVDVWDLAPVHVDVLASLLDTFNDIR